MGYDFESIISRSGCGSVKWDGMKQHNPNVSPDVMPLSVADMEFLTAPEIREGLKRYIDTTILGYTAMSGAVGGGGLGMIAITYGYNRYRYAVLYAAVIVLVIIVQVIQSFGTWLATKSDKRLKK